MKKVAVVNHFVDIPTDLVNQSEAARLRGVSHQAISRLVKNGRLPTYEVAGILFLRKSDVLAFEARPGRPKSDDKKKSVRKAPRQTTSRK